PDLTPVISRTNVIDSGSMRSPKSTCSASTGIHDHSVVSAAWVSDSEKNSARPYTKDAATVAQPSRWPQPSVRLPPSNSTSAPSAGNATSSHDDAITTISLRGPRWQGGHPDASRWMSYKAGGRDSY